MNILKIKPITLSPSTFVFTSFRSFAGIGTSFTLPIHKIKPIKQIYTRDFLENYSRNPNFEADQLIENKEKLKKDYENYLLNHEANDKNSKNLIQVKQKSLFFLPEHKFQPKTLFSQQELPLYSLVQPRIPKILIEGVRRKVPSKLKKLIGPMKSIIGLHYYDALALMGSRNRKSMKYISRTLIQVKNHAINRGFDETRLYVVEALTGKHKRNFGVRYHGKGRAGRIKHDLCQLRIKLEEKTYEDLYKRMYAGKTPPMLAYALRQKLLENNAGYEEIRKYSWVLTGKGRQQHKLMLKRRVFLTHFHNLKAGRKIPKKIIEQKILEDEAAAFGQRMREENSKLTDSSLSRRQEIFKKNEGKSG